MNKIPIGLIGFGRTWGSKAAISVLDQGIMSGANFLLNVILARWLSPTEYGAFAIAFTVFLFFAGFHNALVLEPMSVLGPSSFRHSLPSYMGNLISLNFCLSAGLGLLPALAALFIDEPVLSKSLLGLAISTPPLLFFWLFRRNFYLNLRPDLATSSSLAYAGTLVAGLLALYWTGWFALFTVFVLLAAAGSASAAFGFRFSEIRFTPRILNGITDWRRKIIKEHWRYGKWLVATAVLTSGINYIHTFIAAAYLGLDAAGVLRAMFNLVLPVVLTISAISEFGLPILSSDYGQENHRTLVKKGFMFSVALTGFACLFETVFLLFPGPIEAFFYGGKFSEYSWLIPVLGLIPAFTGLGSGYSLILRATQKPQHYLLVAAGTCGVGVTSAFLFIQTWGLAGAAASMVVTCAASTLITALSYLIFAPKMN